MLLAPLTLPLTSALTPTLTLTLTLTLILTLTLTLPLTLTRPALLALSFGGLLAAAAIGFAVLLTARPRLHRWKLGRRCAPLSKTRPLYRPARNERRIGRGWPK